MSAFDHVWGTKGGGPAFPVSIKNVGPDDSNIDYKGMELRDYFAAKAPITLSEAAIAEGMGDDMVYHLQHAAMGDGRLFKAHAALCYSWDDAMLAAREEK